MQAGVRTGGCLCGAVRYSVRGEPRGFCPPCGSRLLNPTEPGDTLIEIRIGSLDDAPFELKPEHEIWVKRRESRLSPVEGAEQYDES